MGRTAGNLIYAGHSFWGYWQLVDVPLTGTVPYYLSCLNQNPDGNLGTSNSARGRHWALVFSQECIQYYKKLYPDDPDRWIKNKFLITNFPITENPSGTCDNSNTLVFLNETTVTIVLQSGIRIYDGSRWRTAIPYIYTGATNEFATNGWQLAETHISNGSAWRLY